MGREIDEAMMGYDMDKDSPSYDLTDDSMDETVSPVDFSDSNYDRRMGGKSAGTVRLETDENKIDGGRPGTPVNQVRNQSLPPTSTR